MFKSSLHRWLYAVCVLTDFSAFLVVFVVSRRLAERQVEPWYLGLVGAGLSFCAGVGSILGGWLAHRWSSRGVFLAGAILILASVLGVASSDLSRAAALPLYWLLGIGLGCLYPPLIGWLNQHADARTEAGQVSRALILFCVAWNIGMLSGQLTAGALFEYGSSWVYGVACVAATFNTLAATHIARRAPRWTESVTTPPAAADAPLPEQGAAWRRRAIQFQRLGWIANLGGMFGGSMVIHLLPDLAVALGVPADRHGMLLAGWRIVIIATYGLLHATRFWQFRFDVAVASQAIAALGLITIAAASHAGWLMLGLALLGQLVGFNYFSGLYYSTAGSESKGRALAAGIHEATLAAGMALGTMAGGALATYVNHRIPYALAAVALMGLVVVQAYVRRRSASSQS